MRLALLGPERFTAEDRDLRHLPKSGWCLFLWEQYGNTRAAEVRDLRHLPNTGWCLFCMGTVWRTL